MVQDSDGRAWSVSVEKRCMVRHFLGHEAVFSCQHGHAMLIAIYNIGTSKLIANGEAVYFPSELQGQFNSHDFFPGNASLPR